MKRIIAIVLALLLAFVVVAGITATPLVGEVVTLHTRDAAGEWQTTPLWIVDTPGGEYLRAGNPESGWVARLRAEPAVRLERGGQLADVRLVPEPAMLDEVNARMAESYGWADTFVGMMGDHAGALPFRVNRERGDQSDGGPAAAEPGRAGS